MRRQRPKDIKNRQTYTGEIRKDLSAEQRALIGDIAMAYNEVEKRIDFLFFVATRLKGDLQFEVSTRINGVDGKIAIIKKGAELAGLSTEEQSQLSEALGAGVFGKYKQFRDSIIHARITDGAMGVGMHVASQGRLFDVLLSKDALEALFQHLEALAVELDWGAHVVSFSEGQNDARYSPQDKASFAEARSTWSVRFQARRTLRQSLPPIPEFPSEPELDEAATQWHKARSEEMMRSLTERRERTPLLSETPAPLRQQQGLTRLVSKPDDKSGKQ